MILGIKFGDGMIFGFMFYIGLMVSKLILFVLLSLALVWLKKEVSKKLPKKYLWGALYHNLPTQRFCAWRRIKLPDSSNKRYVK